MHLCVLSKSLVPLFSHPSHCHSAQTLHAYFPLHMTLHMINGRALIAAGLTFLYDDHFGCRLVLLLQNVVKMDVLYRWNSQDITQARKRLLKTTKKTTSRPVCFEWTWKFLTRQGHLSDHHRTSFIKQP